MPVLSVQIESVALERVEADVLVVGLAPGDRPLRGAAGHADWRLCGRLSRLVAAGHVSGLRGEASLVVASTGLASPLVVLVGLGPRDALDAAGWLAVGEDAAQRALDLRAGAIALGVLDDADPPERLRVAVSSLLCGVSRALAAAGRDARVLLLGDAAALGPALRAASTAPLAAGVELRQRAASSRPRAAAASAPHRPLAL